MDLMGIAKKAKEKENKELIYKLSSTMGSASDYIKDKVGKKFIEVFSKMDELKSMEENESIVNNGMNEIQELMEALGISQNNKLSSVKFIKNIFQSRLNKIEIFQKEELASFSELLEKKNTLVTPLFRIKDPNFQIPQAYSLKHHTKDQELLTKQMHAQTQESEERRHEELKKIAKCGQIPVWIAAIISFILLLIGIKEYSTPNEISSTVTEPPVHNIMNEKDLCPPQLPCSSSRW